MRALKTRSVQVRMTDAEHLYLVRACDRAKVSYSECLLLGLRVVGPRLQSPMTYFELAAASLQAEAYLVDAAAAAIAVNLEGGQLPLESAAPETRRRKRG